METVKKLSTSIMEQLEPTNAAFRPLLRARQDEILTTKRRTFKYGDTERHYLDVYYPTPANLLSRETAAPVLVFAYGGGYVTGDRVQAPPQDLIYRNVGAFFAKHGFATVIPDYRLYPIAKYPDPAIDLRDALTWLTTHISSVNSPSEAPVPVDLSRIFIMGHSAGGAIVATLLLDPSILPPSSSADVRAAIKGAIVKGGVYHYRGANPINPDVLAAYYGSEQERAQHEPLGLLENAPQEVLDVLPPILATVSERESPPIAVAHKDFVKALEEKIGKERVETYVMEGHNHVSVMDALMSGEGEDWAYKVIGWMRTRLAKI